jgi:LEA14-like dessication related protein
VKKIILIVLAVILISAAALAAYFYFYPSKAQNIIVPEIEQLENLKIKVKGDTAFMDLSLKLINSGPFKMNIDSLIYNVKFDTATLLSRAQDLKIVLRPGEVDTFSIPARLPFKRLFSNIRRMQGFDSVAILTDIRIVYSTIFGRASIPHKKTNTIAVPIPPRFEIEQVEYVSRDKKTVYLNAHIKMHNPGRIELKVFNLKYDLKVEDLFDADGSYPEQISVKPNSVISKVLPVTVNVNKAFKTFIKIITDNDKVKYKIRIRGQVLAEALGDEKTDIEIFKNGTMELRKK